MKAELRHYGKSQSPVVIIDGFSGVAERVAEMADALAPFDKAGNYYPGVRRNITPADNPAFLYVEQVCRAATRFVGSAFKVDGFNLLGASFSVVATDPADLEMPQRAPHFDSVDPFYIALLHYLRVPDGSGTAFYRQRSTNIERVTAENLDLFVETAKSEMGTLPDDSGYILGSNALFEEVGRIDAVPDRMVMYQGSFLHSGIIPPEMIFSDDPRKGRLTANLFIRAYRTKVHA